MQWKLFFPLGLESLIACGVFLARVLGSVPDDVTLLRPISRRIYSFFIRRATIIQSISNRKFPTTKYLPLHLNEHNPSTFPSSLHDTNRTSGPQQKTGANPTSLKCAFPTESTPTAYDNGKRCLPTLLQPLSGCSIHQYLFVPAYRTLQLVCSALK